MATVQSNFPIPVVSDSYFATTGNNAGLYEVEGQVYAKPDTCCVKVFLPCGYQKSLVSTSTCGTDGCLLNFCDLMKDIKAIAASQALIASGNTAQLTNTQAQNFQETIQSRAESEACAC